MSCGCLINAAGAVGREQCGYAFVLMHVLQHVGYESCFYSSLGSNLNLFVSVPLIWLLFHFHF